ncbi:MAG: DUF3488 domain-containing protein [Elusimicrobia bacterium]|nr:DUF3488 domain-containing protein [Elusimicrobiota bacterium]
MKLTRSGWGALFLLGLTFAAAGSSGNNLLYLLYGSLVSAFLLSLTLGHWNLRRVESSFEHPDQVFRESEFTLVASLRAAHPLGGVAIWLVRGSTARFVDRVPTDPSMTLELPYRCARRGVNRVDDVFLASSFPLGLILHRRPASRHEIVALPKLREVRSAAEVDSSVQLSGTAVLRKSRTGELYGIREFHPGEHAGNIHWKLTAKTGKLLVVENAETTGSRMTVRLESIGAGPAAEQRIEEAASACRYLVDSGCEVRLVTPETEIGFGRGLTHLDALLRALAIAGAGKTPEDRPPSPPPAGLPALDILPRRRLFVVGAALVYLSLFLIDEINPATLGGLFPILFIGAWIQERGISPLPGLLWNLISAAVLVWIVALDWRISGITLANTHLILYLLTNRLFNPLDSKELEQTFFIMFLGFFLVSGQTISLWYFPSFLVFLGYCGAWAAVGGGARLGQWRRWVPATGAALAGCALLTAGVFAATPRLESRYRINPIASSLGLDKLQASASAITGFTEDVSLGFFGQMKKSSARVMQVRREGSSDAPGSLYVRGAAFDRFDGRRWTKTPRVDFRYRSGARVYSTSGGRAWVARKAAGFVFPSEASKARTYLFTVYPIGSSVLFTAGGVSTLDGGLAPVYFDASDTIYVTAPHSAGVRYRVRGDPEAVTLSRSVVDYPRIASMFLQLPKTLSPKVTELGASLSAGRGTPKEKVLAVQAFLRKGFRYAAYAEDNRTSLEDFLLKSKRGNCEYFATAGAVLLRLAGVPARLVTGFLSDEWNEYGAFYDVRQNQAHAWVETYVDGRWTRFDPTPASSFLPIRSLAERASKWFDAVQAQWYMHVIGYDTYVQHNTFRRIGAGISREAMARAVARLLRLSVWLAAALAVVWLAGAPALARGPQTGILRGGAIGA